MEKFDTGSEESMEKTEEKCCKSMENTLQCGKQKYREVRAAVPVPFREKCGISEKEDIP